MAPQAKANTFLGSGGILKTLVDIRGQDGDAQPLAFLDVNLHFILVFQ